MAFDLSKIRKEIPGQNGERLVVIRWEGAPTMLRNFIKISASGSLIWVVTPKDFFDAVYVDIQFDGENLFGWTYGGFLDTIDYLTGAIIKREFVE